MEQPPVQAPRPSPRPVWGLGEERYNRKLSTAPAIYIKNGRNFAEEKARIISFVKQTPSLIQPMGSASLFASSKR
jgi:hypothetical protein